MSYHIRLGQETEFQITNENQDIVLTIEGDVVVQNNLTVNGVTTTIDTDVLSVEDPLIVAGSGNTLDNTDLGLVLVRNAGNVAIIWDESADQFAFVNTSDDGSASGDLTIDSYADLTVANAVSQSLTLSDSTTVISSSATQALQLAAPELTSGGTDDVGISLTQTLNDPGAAGGSDTYTGLFVNLTQTDVTGWDTINLVDLQINGTPVFTIDSSGNLLASGNVALQGKQTMYIPASAMSPTPTNGATDPGIVELTAGNPCLRVLDFVNANDTFAQFEVSFPKSWDKGTVTFQAFWTVSSPVSTGVAWALQAVCVSNDEPIDVAYGTAVVVTDNAGGSADDLLVSDESAAVTIAGTPADDDVCYFQVYRDVSDAGDDMVEDARLVGVKIFYTTNAGNDE